MIYLVAIGAMTAAVGAEPLSVDIIDGGLSRATLVLIARHGTEINYEGVPRTIEGLHYELAPSPLLGTRRQRLGDRELKFSYPADATPRQRVEAAVAAQNAAPDTHAWYRVVEHDGVIDVIPTHVRNAAGEKVAYTPLLDTVVTLPSATGSRYQLYSDLIDALAYSGEVPVSDMGFMVEDYKKELTLPSATGKARDLLNQIVGSIEGPVVWWAHWPAQPPVGSEPGWMLYVHTSRPEEEAMLNRTPLTELNLDAMKSIDPYEDPTATE